MPTKKARHACAKAALTVLLVAADPLMGCLAGYAEAFRELGDGVVAQLVVFEGISVAVRSR